ncbi:DeoR/GlpR family DNA-binding transcription regulator [Chelativorans sp. YIM 93263]|uniref:DeoR/GlpR family DNA-binding transcription regulator n=1 Tax=Chelativorans sp. YIM 93263 TaxID=2906648 RepID=UPI002379F167|nr:DeoR/GlpR family DNA-binding transcription regulator [Chelativorans sp. YIM 93263]
MRPSVRQAAIYELVEKRGRATVEEIAERYGASVETVRRDLNVLAEQGRVRKIHGGAVRQAGLREGRFEDRLAENTQAKREIAEKLARTVQPGESVMIDTGSTTLLCAEALARLRDLTVITNSTRIAHTIANAGNDSRAILLGGAYRVGNDQTYGAKTCAEIAEYRTDHVVLTVSALNASGAYDVSYEEAQIARAMVRNAGNLSLVVDHSKLNRTATHKVCDLTQVRHAFLNRSPDADLAAALRAAQVSIH